MPSQQKTGYYTFLVIYILAIFSIGSWVERYQTVPLLLAYCSAFMGYVFISIKREDSKTLLSVGILVRILLFISLPTLSDDLYRFIWDGTLLKNSIHPFAQLPSYYLDNPVEGLSQELYDRLNSPNYFSIYPPLNQLIFWLSVTLGQSDWLFSANIIRVILVAADVGSFFLLRKLLKLYDKPTSLAYWYWLNPLVILEFTGNLHFEGLVVFFLLTGIYFFEKNRKSLSAAGLGLAIGMKLLPMIYLPFLFLKGLKNKKWWISIVAGLIAIVTLLPMLDTTFLKGMQTSLNLYFRSFEFNASSYFIAREIGTWIYGYNNIALIGPLLSALSFISIMVISIIAYLKNWSLPKTFLFILTIYLIFATTVHPWYILPLVAFGILSGYWYSIIWSFLIFFTYIGYHKDGFELPMFIIVIEYLITGLALLFELRMKKVKT
ncbi:hypothetical protein [Ekhidna sp.]|uniref:hypothetical protein n=1 Tax=Ekhidna sp. TaxID=2608089 RepID=UPI003297F283